MTTVLDGNVHNLAVEGTFDDCQRIMKEVFADLEFKDRLSLGSVNSINWARLLAQAVYYFYAAFRVMDARGADAVSFSVPSGNFGNLTAGVYAWLWGLAVRRFIAATNVNDVVPQYLESGRFAPRPSDRTISNAMDVGNPSNFERLEAVFAGDWRRMAAAIAGASVTDSRTRETMREIRSAWGVFVDPHTAVGCAAARDALRAGPGADADVQMIVLSTAHPAKFADTVREATGEEPELPERLARCLTLPKRALRMRTAFPELSAFLLDSFG